MTNHEKNHANMYNDVFSTMENEKTAFADNPALLEDQQELGENIVSINKHNKEYMDAIKGKTKEKHNAIDYAIKLVNPIKSAVSSFGSKTKNERLKEIT